MVASSWDYFSPLYARSLSADVRLWPVVYLVKT